MSSTAVDEIPAIVASARRAYTSGVTRPLEWRRQQLKCLRRLLEENEADIAKAIATDLRRPHTEAMIEIIGTVAAVSYFSDNLDALTKKEKLPALLSQYPLRFEVWKEPLGVVTIITPWNFPCQLLLEPMAAAIAAGNACVIKPSQLSGAFSELMGKLVRKYMDPSAIGVVLGGVPQATALLAEKVNHIVFTGGSAVGRIVMAAAAKNLTPVTLELGGQCPVYVDESAHLATTARRLLWTKSVNAGQVCIAPNHLLVHERVRDPLIEAIKSEQHRMYAGELQKNPDLSRIINDRHFKRVAGLLENHGGKVVMGGKMDETERYMEVTVITDPDMDSALMKEEIFGPILPVVTVKSVDEAIAISNAGETPLAAYVFEQNAGVRSKWLTEVASGGATVNDCFHHIMNVEESGLCGKGESGMGRTKGKAGFTSLTHRKVVCFQSPTFDPLSKYPPYKDQTLKMLRMILLGEYPTWMKLTFWGSVGALTMVAVTSLSVWVSQHVSVSVSLH